MVAAAGAAVVVVARLPAAPNPARDAPARTRRPLQPRRVELRNLATGAVQSWQDMQSFTFAANSSHLILRRRAPAVAGAAGGRGGAGGPPGGGAPGGGANGAAA